jgi:hypothetical protein
MKNMLADQNKTGPVPTPFLFGVRDVTDGH